MRRLLPFIIAFFMLYFNNAASAQTDSLRMRGADTLQARAIDQSSVHDDDEFMLVLFAYAVAGAGAMAGAMVICSMVAAFAILLCMLFVSVGVISASLLAGFYKRSVSAGFKTFVLIVCAVGGGAIGSTGLLIVTTLFRLHLSGQTAFLIGGAGGLAGGIFIGLIIYKTLCYLLIFLKKKLQIG